MVGKLQKVVLMREEHGELTEEEVCLFREVF